MADQTDTQGNTAFHQLSRRWASVETLDDILSAGVDVNQANHAGRAPLHALCSAGHDNAAPKPAYVQRVDWFLQHADVDVADPHGIRPLHIASTLSEYFVKALLGAGADPSAATVEGLTPLHIAARACQSNIVGMLLAALSRQAPPSAGAAAACVSAADAAGRTPLHYACRSGRGETVSLLLGAGADAQAVDLQGRSVLDACTEFEDEQVLWDGYRKPTLFDWDSVRLMALPEDWNEDASGGTRLDDELRPWVKPGRALNRGYLDEFGEDLARTFVDHSGQIRTLQDTTRLEDILPMLHRASGTASHFEESLARCAHALESCVPSKPYTLRCFRDFLGTLRGTEPTDKAYEEYDARVLRAVPAALWDDEEAPSIDSLDEGVCKALLRQREYGVVRRIIRRVSPLALATENFKQARRLLQYLAREGFADLASTMLACNPHVRQGFLDEDGLRFPAKPILFSACQSELPNMDVVRLLVETFHVNVNQQSAATGKVDEIRLEFSTIKPEPGFATAVHELAMGKHWWVAAQAIPYLRAHGADLAITNQAGQTPMEVAESRDPPTVFQAEVMRALE